MTPRQRAAHERLLATCTTRTYLRPELQASKAGRTATGSAKASFRNAPGKLLPGLTLRRRKAA